MDQYITGSIIKKLREAKEMTQAELAQKLGISDKAVSKWETGKGYPDITLIEPLAQALEISVSELFSGQSITNSNRSCNMLRCKLYVCPVCGKVVASTGEAAVCCCGITLPPLEAEDCDSAHMPKIEKIEDEYYVTLNHEMTKEHYISFIAAFADNASNIVKLYPEGNAEAYFKASRVKLLYFYCNKHGLFKVRI